MTIENEGVSPVSEAGAFFHFKPEDFMIKLPMSPAEADDDPPDLECGPVDLDEANVDGRLIWGPDPDKVETEVAV